MSKCEFYRTEVKTVGRHQIRADRMPGPPQRIVMPWCAHPTDSPVPRDVATKTIGGGSRLTCGGDLSKCPIADKL